MAPEVLDRVEFWSIGGQELEFEPALLGQDDACTTWLTQAIELDQSKRELARNNPDFEGLWYKPAFRKLFGYQ